MSPDSETANTLSGRLDPVAQALFSARLMVDVLPQIWRLDPAEGESCLNELCRMTQNALHEMNALFDELQGVNRGRARTNARINEED